MDNEVAENKDEVLEQEANEKEVEKLEEEKHEELVSVVEKTLGLDDEAGGEEKEETVAKETKEELDTEKEAKEVKDISTKDDEKSETTKEGEVKISDLKLPKRLTQAAKRSHISDEEVIALGDKAGMVLGKLADNLDVVSERLGALGRNTKLSFKPEEKKEAKATTLKLPDEMADTEFGKQLQEYMGVLTEQITNMEQKLSEKNSQSTKVDVAERDAKIDKFFDGVTKEYSEFGNSKALTNAETIMRQNVWEKADDIMVGSQLNGDAMPLDEALQQAISIYEGKNPTKVKAKLVDEVIKREKNLISRPRSKKSKVAEKEGRNAAVSAVKAFMQERGKDGWE